MHVMKDESQYLPPRRAQVKTVAIFEPLRTHAMSEVTDVILKLRLDVFERLGCQVRSASAA